MDLPMRIAAGTGCRPGLLGRDLLLPTHFFGQSRISTGIFREVRVIYLSHERGREEGLPDPGYQSHRGGSFSQTQEFLRTIPEKTGRFPRFFVRPSFCAPNAGFRPCRSFR